MPWPRKPRWRRVSVSRGSLPWILILPRWALEKPATMRSRVVFPAPSTATALISLLAGGGFRAVQQGKADGEDSEGQQDDGHGLAVQARHDLFDLRAVVGLIGRAAIGGSSRDGRAGELDFIGAGGEAVNMGLGARLFAEIVEAGAIERHAVGRDEISVLVLEIGR